MILRVANLKTQRNVSCSLLFIIQGAPDGFCVVCWAGCQEHLPDDWEKKVSFYIKAMVKEEKLTKVKGHEGHYRLGPDLKKHTKKGHRQHKKKPDEGVAAEGEEPAATEGMMDQEATADKDMSQEDMGEKDMGEKEMGKEGMPAEAMPEETHKKLSHAKAGKKKGSKSGAKKMSTRRAQKMPAAGSDKSDDDKKKKSAGKAGGATKAKAPMMKRKSPAKKAAQKTAGKRGGAANKARA